MRNRLLVNIAKCRKNYNSGTKVHSNARSAVNIDKVRKVDTCLQFICVHIFWLIRSSLVPTYTSIFFVAVPFLNIEPAMCYGHLPYSWERRWREGRLGNWK